MDTDTFRALVQDAIDSLPDEFLHFMENVDVVVQRFPTRRQLAAVGLKSRYSLLGLYEGTPLTERGSAYSLVLPDKVTIFQAPILAICATDEDIRQEIQDTVIHELGHHFGIDETRMSELEAERDKKRGSV
jgi:predicted Zn-dependent protease with MMP-like domain